MIGAISALAILLIAYWYYKTAEELNLPVLAWVAGGVIVYYAGFLIWMHVVLRSLLGGQFKEHGILLGVIMDLTAVLVGMALSALFRSKIMLKKA